MSLRPTKRLGTGSLVKTYVHIDKEEDGVSAYVFKHPLPSDLKCILCGKLFEDPVLSPSGYTYCYKCIRRRIKRTGTCPITGRSLTEEQLEPNELAIALIDQIELYPAKRLGKHWVPITDKTKKTITFGLRRLYKNTYLKATKEKDGEGDEEGFRDPAENYDIYELFTYLIIVSLLIYGVLRTEFLGNQLRQARVPLMILLSVPGVLLVLYVIIEQVYSAVGTEDYSDSEEEGEG
ncbi:hypothetical protein HOP50_03g21460 [Chloropicon primus]|uniref:RING-type domain-containing protein n=1 Tax=Chloropicon primus TaxID=1764295 RepID=A0A5B8MG38_9CHLO|nr:hypothetical protein A3770_03p21460 [Chloropicon primus]UPQ98840.1 hypothetical protein HOP50_03g21460 [Chloropicon primus]|eukprot:QDZ19628.1 hypothetical protein A3770_03p21460 [Chloropicon primus]